MRYTYLTAHKDEADNNHFYQYTLKIRVESMFKRDSILRQIPKPEQFLK